MYKEKMKCPLCGYEGNKEEYFYMHEATIYVVDDEVEREERERPILVICPRCKQGFFLIDPYLRFRSKGVL
ncbi:MAG: hypothetical protein QXE81_04960 [Desulfurococcaceae archaeon]